MAAGRPASTFPRFRNFFGDKRKYLRGFGYQGSASRQGWQRAVDQLGVGGAFKDAAATPGQWTMGATAFGEMLPNHANRISLDAAKTDKWGLPVLAIDCATGENERLMRRDMMNDMAEMLEAPPASSRCACSTTATTRAWASTRWARRAWAAIEDLGVERAQPGLGLRECVRDRRFVHDLVGVPESVAGLHGVDGASGSPCGRRIEAGEPRAPKKKKPDHPTRGDSADHRHAWRHRPVGGDALWHSRSTRRPARDEAQGTGAFTVADSRCSTRSRRRSFPRPRRPARRRRRPERSWR